MKTVPHDLSQLAKKQVHVQCARANARRGPQFPLAFQLAILQVDDYSVYRSTEGRLCGIFGQNSVLPGHPNGLSDLPLICIQNSHRPVGLQAGMPMETPGLAVHLHVHTARELAFCQLRRIMRDCFHAETSIALKMCPFLHIL